MESETTVPARRIPLEADEGDVVIDLGRFSYGGVEIAGRVRVRRDMLNRLRNEVGHAVASTKGSVTLNRIRNAVQIIGTVIQKPRRE